MKISMGREWKSLSGLGSRVIRREGRKRFRGSTTQVSFSIPCEPPVSFCPHVLTWELLCMSRIKSSSQFNPASPIFLGTPLGLLIKHISGLKKTRIRMVVSKDRGVQ